MGKKLITIILLLLTIFLYGCNTVNTSITKDYGQVYKNICNKSNAKEYTQTVIHALTEIENMVNDSNNKLALDLRIIGKLYFLYYGTTIFPFICTEIVFQKHATDYIVGIYTLVELHYKKELLLAKTILEQLRTKTIKL